MTTAQLTPSADTTPAVANVPERERSGAAWVSRFPGSASIDDLEDGFQQNVARFVEAMRAAGMTVVISATHRPAERAYLMHWAWKIANNQSSATNIPAFSGVDIQWDHGNPTDSRNAAVAMVHAYGMSGLQVAPALQSRHTEQRAIDMTISWSVPTISIVDATAQVVAINSTPRSGMNATLKAVGRSYGVIKFIGGATDKPHWSTDGH